MLASLMINNVVLIDRLAIHFEPGLCALTGETGAGKSILLDSMGLALGARSESGLVRKGEDSANVSAEFDLPADHPVFALLGHHDIVVENPLILRRSVNADGKSRAFINDYPVSVSLLRQAGEMLVEIHGQFDTQTLLNPRVHRGIVDEYAGIVAEADALGKLWNEWTGAQKSLQDRVLQIEQAKRDHDYLSAALAQLEELSPQKGEEEKLSTLRSRLMKREQILENLSVGSKAADDAQAALNIVWRALDKSGDATADIKSALDRANAELAEVSSGMESLSRDLEESEYSLTEIDDRLYALKAQARKHACSIDDLPGKQTELADLLKDIEDQGDTLASLEASILKLKKAYLNAAQSISRKRQSAAQQLDKLVAKELAPLKLERARFETSVEALPENDWGPSGIDSVQFLVATNPGTQAGPLHKIASGGEMARFMLALKVVLAEVGVAQTLVFDEVDSGIGGATADAVGERLARLADKRQILVVTHSPQVAARSSSHSIVVKTGKTNPTTKVIPLSQMIEREEEIARMLSGSEITREARAAAAKLLEKSAA